MPDLVERQGAPATTSFLKLLCNVVHTAALCSDSALNMLQPGDDGHGRQRNEHFTMHTGTAAIAFPPRLLRTWRDHSKECWPGSSLQACARQLCRRPLGLMLCMFSVVHRRVIGNVGNPRIFLSSHSFGLLQVQVARRYPFCGLLVAALRHHFFWTRRLGLGSRWRP